MTFDVIPRSELSWRLTSFLDLNWAGFCSLILTHSFPRSLGTLLPEQCLCLALTRCNKPRHHSETGWPAKVWKTFLLSAIWSRQGCAPVPHPHHTCKYPSLVAYPATGIKRFSFLIKSSVEKKAEIRRAYPSGTDKHSVQSPGEKVLSLPQPPHCLKQTFNLYNMKSNPLDCEKKLKNRLGLLKDKRMKTDARLCKW